MDIENERGGVEKTRATRKRECDVVGRDVLVQASDFHIPSADSFCPKRPTKYKKGTERKFAAVGNVLFNGSSAF